MAHFNFRDTAYRSVKNWGIGTAFVMTYVMPCYPVGVPGEVFTQRRVTFVIEHEQSNIWKDEVKTGGRKKLQLDCRLLPANQIVLRLTLWSTLSFWERRCEHVKAEYTHVCKLDTVAGCPYRALYSRFVIFSWAHCIEIRPPSVHLSMDWHQLSLNLLHYFFEILLAGLGHTPWRFTLFGILEKVPFSRLLFLPRSLKWDNTDTKFSLKTLLLQIAAENSPL